MVVENKFENGCSITMDTFKDKTNLIKLWKIIKKMEIITAHI